ncbi:VanZ family protein [Aquincola sp. S2]|uniref:VanZ family protein n=1 Tax=Pseudaquabacterium terrae TaxID=2732868 RepID=A0ABX2EC42_9BURK|nr:VanZ family protein [Aquabacterium terrae]NRF66131.1 VanZ family protein [Aquabacterium terrae]
MPGSVRAAARPLAGLWLALVVYATLFPFEGWNWPPGASLRDLLTLRWPRWWGGFDVVANLLGYLPLGLLLALAALREGHGRVASLLRATAGGLLLSYVLEVTQQLLPQRVPSLMDWVLNSAGSALGALLALGLSATGLPARWHEFHNRWLGRGGTGAAVLLLLWPVALLFPAPMPLGLGQIGGLLQEWALVAVADVPWAEAALAWLQTPSPARPLSRFAEGLATALGLLAPCLLAYAASPSPWRRAGLALGAPLVAIAATTLSTALNFGPEHALAWHTPGALTALGVGAALALSLAWIGPRLAAGFALVALTGGVMLVHQAPTDPYFGQSLQGWEQGRFIRFHGLARWVGLLWPYAAMAWLLARLRTAD